MYVMYEQQQMLPEYIIEIELPTVAEARVALKRNATREDLEAKDLATLGAELAMGASAAASQAPPGTTAKLTAASSTHISGGASVATSNTHISGCGGASVAASGSGVNTVSNTVGCTSSQAVAMLGAMTPTVASVNTGTTMGAVNVHLPLAMPGISNASSVFSCDGGGTGAAATATATVDAVVQCGANNTAGASVRASNHHKRARMH